MTFMSPLSKSLFVSIYLWLSFKATLVAAKTSTSAQAASEPFWITAELLSVHFKKGCLTTSICYNPSFKLSTGISEIKEKIGIDWDVNEVMDKKTSKQLITYWPKGDINHVLVEASIVGNDPMYNFPRLCDNAPGKHAFKSSPFVTAYEEEIWNNIKPPSDDVKLVHLTGHCFNATVSVKKHPKYCPWCPEPEETSVEVEPSAEQASFWTLSSTSDQKLANILILIFGLSTIFTTTSFVVLLLLHLKMKKKTQKDTLSELNATTRTIGSESQWSGIFVDQKCRPVLRYIPTSHVEAKYGGGMMIRAPNFDRIMEDSQEGYEIIDNMMTPHRPHVRIPMPRRDRCNHVDFQNYNSSASSYCSPISSTISHDPTPETSPNTTIFDESSELPDINQTNLNHSNRSEEKDKDSGMHSISPER